MDAIPAGTRTDPDLAARRTLARQRGIATGLLVFMAALTLGSFWLPPGWWAELLQAAAKAGFVGGLADWFAVTALFRHPLGVPIPHTAIIPAQKARLGQALGRFVARYVFTEAEVSRTLSRLDLAGIVRSFLTDPAATRPAAVTLASLLPRLVGTIEDGRARKVMRRLLPRMVSGPDAGRLVGRALRGSAARVKLPQRRRTPCRCLLTAPCTSVKFSTSSIINWRHVRRASQSLNRGRVASTNSSSTLPASSRRPS